jgi:NADH-quinone oxidoreductase E subunit
MVSEKTLATIKALKRNYPDGRSVVMGALWAVQRDNQGTLTKADLEEIAGLFEISPVEVQAVASFYTMYNVLRPVGKYHIQVCQNISCSLLGAEHLITHLEKVLGIKRGETTRDRKYSLTTVECLGSCGTAPMMQINDDYHEDLTVARIDDILSHLK